MDDQDLEKREGDKPVSFLKPLFENEEEYKDFRRRHEKATVKEADIEKYSGNAYLGIDCGSTTTKLALISENKELLWSYYDSNKGNPVDVVKEQLMEVSAICKDRITIAGSAVTGYGEELIRNAFHIDKGIVETMAHFMASKHFCNDLAIFIFEHCACFLGYGDYRSGCCIRIVLQTYSNAKC